MVGRAHLSIGEVLSLLHDEFPEVTISKIRFLESQGLVDPERTPSGYRKFYEPDIERLRWVLRQQRDAFLPLKVIKDRLEEHGDPDADEAGAAEAETDQTGIEEGPVKVEVATEMLYGNGGGVAAGPAQLFDMGPPSAGYVLRNSGREAAVTSQHRVSRAHAAESATSPVQGSPAPVGVEVGPAEHRVSPKSARPGRPREIRSPDDDELALAELVDKAGVDVETVRDLEQYGLITPRLIAGAPYYPREAVVIARLAWAFARHGVEARHLRAYKGAAEREAGLVQQVIMPLLRQRNPQAREAAAHAVDELSELGGELRAALLRAALADLR